MPPAQNEAVAGANHRNRAIVDGREGIVTALVHLGDQAAVLGELLDIDPGAEAASLGAQNDDAHLLIAPKRNDGLGQLRPAGAVERVHRRVVQHDLRNAVFDVELD